LKYLTLRLLGPGLAFLMVLSGSSAGATQTQPSVADNPAGSASRDGQGDFDFNFGIWKTHVERLLHPLTRASSWAEYDGTSMVSKVWDGRASLLELDVDGPAGHLEGFGLRLYDPQAHQWSLNWVSGAAGAFDQPMIGQFEGGRGEFVDQELFSGKVILARNSFSDISADFARFEQAFSQDGARTWETNWVMTFARMPAGAESSTPATTGGTASSVHDEQHDFDFAFGTWNTHIRRLKDPLSGSTTWLEYDGVHTIRRVSGGRANLGELEADGPAGHIEALSARLYDPQTHLWRVSYGNSRDGSLSRPMVGQFKDGHGEFYGQETFKGRQVLVREVYSPLDSKRRHLEIAYSADGGRSWETNWSMVDTLVSPVR
jgi:hypothetical protein